MPIDVTTAVLIDEHDVAYKNSDSVLRIFAFMGFPYTWLGPVLLTLFPAVVRDFGYQLFARNRGTFWRGVKRVTGIGETYMEPHRERILGLKEPLDPGWGFEDNTSSSDGGDSSSTNKEKSA
jgi:predicted DCC family thiol-disulfide oxidoreductase YuxK